MAIGRPHQDQNGGENSTNYQAGQDIHVHQGLTIDEAREVAHEVFMSNAIELAGIAQALAVARAEQLTNDFLAKLAQDMPDRAETLADPDMQNVVFEAQKEFARSGEEDLKVTLVDLLAARSGEVDRNLRTLALNEAIVSAPKLTEQQRRAIAWIFFLKYTRDTGSGSPAAYFARIDEVVTALGCDVPTGRADYQHIEYVGAGAISLATTSFGQAMLIGAEGLFTRGFAAADVDEPLLARMQSQNFVIKALRDPSRYQLNLVAEEDLQKRLAVLDLSKYVDEISPLMSAGRMSADEAADEVVAAVSRIAPLRTLWDDKQTPIASVTLTSVGIALGHAYWSRLTGSTAPLSIWLP